MAQKVLRTDVPRFYVATTPFWFRGTRVVGLGEILASDDPAVVAAPMHFRPWVAPGVPVTPAPAPEPEPVPAAEPEPVESEEPA